MSHAARIITRCFLCLSVLAAFHTRPARAQAPSHASSQPVETEKLSDAERIARLQRGIEEGERRLSELRQQIAENETEFKQAEAAFKELDGQFTERRREWLKQGETGVEPSERERADFEALEKKRQLAKERFDLAIQERKTRGQQARTMEERLEGDRRALALLLGAPASQPADAAPTVSASSMPASPAHAPSSKESTGPGPALQPLMPGVPAVPEASPAVRLPMLSPPPPSQELTRASEEAQVKRAEAQRAEVEARSITERLETHRRAIELQRKQVDHARRKADNAQKSTEALRDELRAKWAAGATSDELKPLWDKITEAEDRAHEARLEVAQQSSELDRLHEELTELQAEQINALREAERAVAEASTAEKRVEALQNPLSPRNLWRWILQSGPRVLGILLVMAFLLWLARVMRSRLARLLALTDDHGTREERENRAQTLVSVFSNAVSVAVVAGGSLTILTELGINIVPLMGGAAVAGLAVAFGAQNLIRDYFTGFMILLENQYGINDIVTIAGISGQVERITLRTTVLRDLEGIVHFIPNGQVTTVSNRSHKWSRALLDVPVAYKEDVDRVMNVILECANELRKDPAVGRFIIDEPEMLGVDQFTDSAIVVRCVVKTRPARQWAVKRALLRRIKKRFDAEGIEIPFPHRTVFHRYPEGISRSSPEELMDESRPV